VYRFAKIAVLCLMVLSAALPALAQDKAPGAAPATTEVAATQHPPIWVLSGAAVGSGLVILGAGYGIGRIGSVGRREHGPAARGGRQHSDGHDHRGRTGRRRHVLRA